MTLTVISLLFLSFTWLLSFSHALDIPGKVIWSSDCPGIEFLRPSKVILDNGRIKGSISSDGGFLIPDVPAGTYVLSVVSSNYSFDQLRVDVEKNAVEIRPYVPGTPLNPPSPIVLPYPITMVPKQKHVYFVPRESFNLMGMLSNPMMLMMIAAGGMMLGMPYLMKNMDPEAMEEFKAQHAKVQNAMAGGDMKSGFTAILGADEAVGKKLPPAIKNRANRNKKH